MPTSDRGESEKQEESTEKLKTKRLVVSPIPDISQQRSGKNIRVIDDWHTSSGSSKERPRLEDPASRSVSRWKTSPASLQHSDETSGVRKGRGEGNVDNDKVRRDRRDFGFRKVSW